MKKFLSLSLAFALLAAMVILPITGSAAENLTVDFNDETVGGFTGGTVALDAKTNNPYLSVGEQESASVDLPSALTVDFKLKALGRASAAVGGATLAFSDNKVSFTENGESKSVSFVSGLWYNLRLTTNGTNADLYIDGVKMGVVDGAGESFTSLSVSGAVGIDDVKAYVEAQIGNRGMEATTLDTGLDGLTVIANDTTANQYIMETSDVPVFKQDNAHGTTVANYNKSSWANNINTNVTLLTRGGIYGKTENDKVLEFTHKSASSGVDSNIDFNIADTGFLKEEGDTQVLSFDLAFPEDASNRAMTIRGYGWQSWSGAPYGMGWSGKFGFGNDLSTTNRPVSGPGWIMKIYGDRVYLFGDDTFYAVIPALMPEQWNNIRLEMTKGKHEEGSSELTYKAYMNDVLIVEGDVPYNEVWRDEGASTAPSKREFFGFGRISFNYNWNVQTDYSTSGGFYLDDVNVTNYYGTAPERAESPLYIDNNYTTTASTASEAPATQAGWDHDKWVTGNVVYADQNMTLQQYADSLVADRRVGDVIFRDSAGETITDWDTPIGELVYMEITTKNYERRIIGLVGKSRLLSEYDGTVITSLTAGKWTNSGSNAVLGSAAAGGGCKDMAATLTAAAGKSEPSLRYVLSPRYNSSNYIYTETDRYRPVTFEFSAQMPKAEDGYMRFCGRYCNGPSGAANNALTSSFEKNFIILEKGEIRAQQRSASTATTLLGTYNPGEWNHFAVTYYPGIQTNRIDIRVNGEYVQTSGNTSKAWSGAMMLANSAIKLQTIEEFIIYYRNSADDSQPVTSTLMLNNLKVHAGYYEPQEAPALAYSGRDCMISENTITPFRTMTAQSLTGTLSDGITGTLNGIYTDGDYAAEQEGSVADGNKIVLQNGDVVRYYTVSMPSISVFQRDSENLQQPVTGQSVVPGREVIVSAPGIEKGQLFLAVYADADCRRLLWANTDYSASLDTPRVGTVDFTLQAGNVIKVFYFAPGGGLQPVLPVKTLMVTE